MAKILFTWELGAGLGHMLPIKALAKNFTDDGHQVYIALRDLQRATALFDDLPVKLLQAPCATTTGLPKNQSVDAYGQLLLINGYHDETQLLGLCRAWQALYELIEPDILLCDHSPTALLAARGQSMMTVPMGNGFTIPPATTPLGVFRPDTIAKPQLEQVKIDEEMVLQRCNSVLEKLAKPKLERLEKLYRDSKNNAFLSLEEFDHFGARGSEDYLGIAEHAADTISPNWPLVEGKKLFVYLKLFEGINTFLQQLVRTPASIILYSTDIPDEILRRYQAEHIQYENHAVNLQQVAEQADSVIINANHSTLMHFVISEVPIMMLPLHQEQQLMAQRMQSQGIGLHAPIDDHYKMAQCLNTLLSIDRCSKSVLQVAERYRYFDASKAQRDFCRMLIEKTAVTGL